MKIGWCAKNRGNTGMHAAKKPQHISTGGHRPIMVTPHVKSGFLSKMMVWYMRAVAEAQAL